MSVRKTALFLLFVTTFLFCGSLKARIIHVPDDQETIQTGIDAAEDGDSVLVQPGIYYENINFEGKGITVGSLYLTTGDTAYVDSTIIDGDRNGRSVVVFRNGEDDNSVLTGLTIQNGYTDWGGGVYCNSVNPSLNYMIIKDNSVSRGGGGIYISRESSPYIAHVTITNNSSLNEDPNIDAHGGGISCYMGATPVIEHALIINNESEAGGGIAIWQECQPALIDVIISDNNSSSIGGGIHIYQSGAVLNDVDIIHNNSRAGGGLSIDYGSEITVENTIIQGNESQIEGGGVDVYSLQGDIELNKVLIANNRSGHGGIGALHIHGGSGTVTLTNTTLTNNYSPDVTAFLMTGYNLEIWIANSIIWANEPGNMGFLEESEGVRLYVSYSDIQGGRGGISNQQGHNVHWEEENIASNPLFIDQENNNYHLEPDSPCIDAGDPDADLDSDGSRADMGAYYFHQRDIEIDQEALEFTGVQTETADSLALIIRNSGGTPLLITSQEITPEDTPFSTSGDDGEFEIDPDSTHLTWIVFSPQIQTEYQATLTIASDDPDEDVIEIQLTGSALGIGEYEELLPASFGITSITPNPFNSTTRIDYSLDQAGPVNLFIYDLSGRRIRTLNEGSMNAGYHSVLFDATHIPSGIYIVRLEADRRFCLKKMTVIR